MFGVYSWIQFIYVSSLTEKRRLMRIQFPTVALLESLPLAYCMSVAAAHSGRISVPREEGGDQHEIILIGLFSYPLDNFVFVTTTV